MAKKKKDTLEEQTARIPTSSLKLIIKKVCEQLPLATSPEAAAAIQERKGRNAMSKKPRFDWPAWQAHLASKLPILGLCMITCANTSPGVRSRPMSTRAWTGFRGS